MATKSGKRRIVPIDDYIVEVHSNIKKSYKKALKKAGIEDFTFHDLRHTFASHAVMNGMDLYTLQKILGHSSIKMTERYSYLSNDHLKKCVKEGSI